MFPCPIHIVGKGKLGRSISLILSNKSVEHTLHGRDFNGDVNGLIYLCLPENIIPTTANIIPPRSDIILLHASGSLGFDCLQPHDKIGCLHPIQSFAGPEIEIPAPIPATFQCVESHRESLEPIVVQFSQLLGFTLFPYSGSRLTYHTAAVVSGNFAAIIFQQAVHLLVSQGLSPSQARSLLHPLALQSIQNASKGPLKEILTGPIARKQQDLLDAQLQNLSPDPLMQSLYEIVVQLGHRDLH